MLLVCEYDFGEAGRCVCVCVCVREREREREKERDRDRDRDRDREGERESMAYCFFKSMCCIPAAHLLKQKLKSAGRARAGSASGSVCLCV